MKDYEKPEGDDALPPAASKITKPTKNVGGRPRKDPTKSPQFQAAVAAAAEAAKADIIAQLTAQFAAARGTDPAAAPAASDQNAILELTKSLMAMVNAGKPEKPLSPEEVQSRADGRQRLIELLVPVQTTNFDAEDAPEAPFYRVIAKTYLTDHVVEPYEVDNATKALVPRTIHWTGTPNDCLEPINEIAKQIHAAYLQSIGGGVAAEFDASISAYGPDGRPFGVTPGGIVVRALNPSARRTVGALPAGSTTDVMGIRGQSDPRAKQINVLGTVAAPAIASEAPKFAGQLR